MGENQNGPFQLSFNASLKVDFQGSRFTSDGGLILVRELDERLVDLEGLRVYRAIYPGGQNGNPTSGNWYPYRDRLQRMMRLDKERINEVWRQHPLRRAGY